MEGEGPPAPPGGARRGSGAGPDVLVFLADGAAVPLALEHPPGATAAELLRLLRDALRLPEANADALALWLVSPLLEVQLKPKHQPFRLCRQWPELLLRFSDASDSAVAQDEPCLQLRRNVFFSKKKELQLEDEELLRLLYEEARGNLLGGRYPCDPEDREELGALVCRLRLGPFDERRHTAAALRQLLGREVPGPRGARGLLGALRRGGRGAPELGLLRAFRAAPGPAAAPPALYRAFLRRCHQLPYYGCAFFPGAIDRPPGGLLSRGGRRAVSVAVGLEGVSIIDPREQHVLLTLAFPELCWELVGAVGPGDAVGPADAVGQEEAVGPPQLWLEFDGDHEGSPVNRLLRVLSPQAELMSALIECCIALGGGDGPGPPRAPLRRQDSVTRPRLQRLNTIDYVDDGQELRRVKPPRRTASFFGRQFSHGGATHGGAAHGGTYTPVPGGAALEQG
ncbi:FERM domain-containing protein 8 isoform X1 [Dromaius novaehollandiae]|uniref:FERM domain-containing protein 8 isoform X1 n=1 Tax=Dromaius novaehollandiae TaxID=8790 RepID=UPI00311DB619